MKKFIIAFLSVLTIISSTAFAGVNKGTNPALATFQNEFKGAVDVKWSEEKDIISASFVLGNTRAVAYFNYSGELLYTARNILFNQLPLIAITEINKRFGTTPVYDILEYTTGAETFYLMRADLPEKELRLKVSSDGDISVVKKVKK
jgi:hypothetical protein